MLELGLGMAVKDIVEDLGNCIEALTTESLTDCFKLTGIVSCGFYILLGV